MPTVRTDDNTHIAYKIVGNGPRNVLFMHGWAGSGSYFEELIRHMDLAGLRIVTYDLRGHGDSDKTPGGYTLDCFAQDGLAVADDAGLDKMVLVGFSMSGKFAQYLACLRPDRIEGLVLIAGTTASKLPFPAEIQRDWVSRVGNREKLMEVTRMFVTQPVRAEIIERWGDDAIKVPEVALNETLNMCIETDFLAQTDALRMPALAIGGIYDSIFSPDVLRQTVMSPLPQARLALLDCNHEIPIEQPQALAAVLQGFLAGLPQ